MMVPTMIIMVWILAAAFPTGNGVFTCVSSSSSEAKRIQKVYDDNKERGHLWDINESPLVPCNFSSIYSSESSVCLDDSAGPETVLVALFNRTNSMKPVFDGPLGNISFHHVGCPRPGPVATSRANDERGRIGVYIPLVITLIVTLPLIIVVIVYLAREHLKRQQAPAKGPNIVFRPVNDSAEIKMPENGHAAAD